VVNFVELKGIVQYTRRWDVWRVERKSRDGKVTLGSKVQGSGLKVWGLGFRVWGLVFRV
jgi:hypothetical protein